MAAASSSSLSLGSWEAASSRILTPFRELGVVCDGNAFKLNKLGDEVFICVSNKNGYHMYNLSKLQLLFVSPRCPSPLNSLDASSNTVFAASGVGIQAFVRTRRVWSADIAIGHQGFAATGSTEGDDADKSIGRGASSLSGNNRASKSRRRSSKGSTKQSDSSSDDTVMDEQPGGRRRVSTLLRMGDHLACGVDGGGSAPSIAVFSTAERAVIGEIPLSGGQEKSEHDATAPGIRGQHRQGGGSGEALVTCMVHPDTYLNKLIACTSTGLAYLVNIRSRRVVHVFDFGGSSEDDKGTNGASRDGRGAAGGGAVGITCVAQSGVVDVLAFGLRDGRILIHDVRKDKPIATMTLAKAHGIPAGLSFRTDELAQLAVGCTTGDVVVWDLNTLRLSTIIANAHDTAAASHVAFVAGEPILVTAGADNALKVWIFDQSDKSARLLRARDGHAEAPTRIAFYGADGLQLISTGRDRTVRNISVVKDSRNRQLSQGTGQKLKRRRLAPVVAFDASTRRERDWGNMVSCHESDPRAWLWSYKDKKLLRDAPLETPAVAAAPAAIGAADQRGLAAATAVCLSVCGNFAFVGTADGVIHKFNAQSQLHRFCTRTHGDGVDSSHGGDNGDDAASNDAGASGENGEHTGVEGDTGACEVTGLGVDGWDETLVSCGLDGCVRWWTVDTLKPTGEVDVGTPLSCLTVHRESRLAAAAGDDFGLRVFDMENKRLVRVFAGKHTDTITDVAFTTDGRMLAATSADGTMTLWRLPTATLVDWVKFEAAPTAVAVSPNMEFFATCHANAVGVCLWVNRLMYENVFLDTPPDRPVDLSKDYDADNRLGDGPIDPATITAAADGNDDGDSGVGPAAEDKGQLVALSGLPRAFWHSLQYYDKIKERNRPTEAPKVPENIPFFLQATLTNTAESKVIDFFAPASSMMPIATSSGEDMEAASGASGLIAGKTGGAAPNSKFIDMGSIKTQTELERALERGDDAATLREIKVMSVAKADFVVQSLPVADDANVAVAFLDFVERQLNTRENYELMQVYLSVFLKYHKRALVGNDEVAGSLRRVRVASTAAWAGVDRLLNSNLCLTSFFASMSQ